MTASLEWTKAAALLKLPREGGWPSRLDVYQLATLQAADGTESARVIAATLLDACKAGELRHEPGERAMRPGGVRGIRTIGRLGAAPAGARMAAAPAVVVVKPAPRVAAADVVHWLQAQRRTPSPLVAAWLAAQEQPAEQADDGKRWTGERIAEARAMRDRLKAAGRRDFMAATAAHYAVTPQRLREVLGEPKRASKPKPGAAIARLVHRLK